MQCMMKISYIANRPKEAGGGQSATRLMPQGVLNMARLVQAMREYGPKLELGPTVETEGVIEWILENNRILRKSMVQATLMEIVEAVLHFNSQGQAVRVEGLGIFTPSIDRNGVIKHGFRADADLKRRSNEEGTYRGKIINEEHIGLDNAGYEALWDADHPDDPLEI